MMIPPTISSLFTHLPMFFGTARQEDVFKSISENVGPSNDGGRMLAVLFGLIGLAILFAVINQRRKREISPRVVNHYGKLLKEVTKSLDLKPQQLKQLKLLAEQKSCSSPLTLLLCPSLLGQAIKDRKK